MVQLLGFAAIIQICCFVYLIPLVSLVPISDGPEHNKRQYLNPSSDISILAPSKPPHLEQAPSVLKPYGTLIGSRLGGGVSGNVYRLLGSRDHDSNSTLPEALAVKVFDFEEEETLGTSATNLRYLKQEYRIGKILSSYSNFARTVSLANTGRQWFLVMEYCTGSLNEALVKAVGRAALSPSRVEYKNDTNYLADLYREVVDSIYIMHKNGIAHGDIKVENVLLGNDQHAKVIDFGSAFIFQYATSKKKHLKSGDAGTIPYLPPESHPEGSLFDPVAADIWALGVLYCIIVLKRVPWKSASLDDEDFRRFALPQYSYLNEFCPKHRSPTCGQDTYLLSAIPEPTTVGREQLIMNLPVASQFIIGKMLEIEPCSRATWSDILADPWIQARS